MLSVVRPDSQHGKFYSFTRFLGNRKVRRHSSVPSKAVSNFSYRIAGETYAVTVGDVSTEFLIPTYNEFTDLWKIDERPVLADLLGELRPDDVSTILELISACMPVGITGDRKSGDRSPTAPTPPSGCGW